MPTPASGSSTSSILPTHEQLVQARENQILAVVIDGRHRHGRMSLLGFYAWNQERVVIDGKDYTLDFTEPRDDPLAGPSLAAATALLTEGLAHLPNLATKAPEPNTMGIGHDIKGGGRGTNSQGRYPELQIH